jgi:hypothetical protein
MPLAPWEVNERLTGQFIEAQPLKTFEGRGLDPENGREIQLTEARESVDSSMMSDLCRLIWCTLIGLFPFYSCTAIRKRTWTLPSILELV